MIWLWVLLVFVGGVMCGRRIERRGQVQAMLHSMMLEDLDKLDKMTAYQQTSGVVE